MPDQATPNVMQGLLIPLGVMFMIFYFLVFRPQIKTQKDHAKMLKDLKKNDEVVTRGGLIGTIVNLKDDSLTLRVDQNVRVEIDRSAVERLRNAPAAAAK